MSSAFVRNDGSVPRVFASRASADSNAEMQRAIEGAQYDFEVRARERGGFMVARLEKDGAFVSWIEE